MNARQKLTYKERQDVMWALEEHARQLIAQNDPTATESATRLQRLYIKYRNGERG